MCRPPSPSEGLGRPLNASHAEPDFDLDLDPESLLLPLKETSNVIVLARLQELRSMSTANLFLAMLSIFFFLDFSAFFVGPFPKIFGL